MLAAVYALVLAAAVAVLRRAVHVAVDVLRAREPPAAEVAEGGRVSLRLIATVLAALALASFVFPFFAVTYDGRPLIHFTGLELVLGTTFRRSFEYGGQVATPGHVAAEFTAMLAVAMLACSVVLTWLRSAWANFAGIYTSMASWALILFLEGKTRHATAASFPNTDLERAPAWWTALVAAGALTIVTRQMAYARLRERRSKENAPAEAGASQ